jgi:hypothetical protein
MVTGSILAAFDLRVPHLTLLNSHTHARTCTHAPAHRLTQTHMPPPHTHTCRYHMGQHNANAGKYMPWEEVSERAGVGNSG